MAFVFDRTDIFNAGGWIPVNKALAKAVGLDAAVIYGEMTRKEEYFKNHGMTVNGGWFYVTEQDLEESTTLKRSKQDKAIAALIKAGMIEKKTMGLPAKRYFRILESGLNFTPPTKPGRGGTTKNVENQQPDNGAGSVEEGGEKTEKAHHYQVVENQQTGLAKNSKQEGRNSTRNNNKQNNNISNNNNALPLNSSSSSYRDINQRKTEEETTERETINSFTKQYLKDVLQYNDFTINAIEKVMQKNGVHTFSKLQMQQQDVRMKMWQRKNGRIVDWAKFFVNGILMAGGSYTATENDFEGNYSSTQEKRRTRQPTTLERLGFDPVKAFRKYMGWDISSSEEEDFCEQRHILQS